MKKYCFFMLFCYLQVTSAVIYKLSDEEYALMPPYMELAPFDSCLKEPRGVYCTTYLTYVSDEDSHLLRMMQDFSAHITSHMNHTRAIYGVCVTQKCNHLYKYKTKKDLTTVLEACLNETLWQEYKLKSLTEELLCSFEDDDKMEISTLHIIVAGVCVSIVLFNIVGSIYDINIVNKGPGLVSHLFLCFSIPRNWKRLTAPPATKGDPRLKTLISLHGIRAMSMILVVVAHSLLLPILLNRSPKFIESTYEYKIIQIFLNGTLIMQTFFMTSSMLLVYHLLLLSEQHQFSWYLLPVAIWRRWLRLTPPFVVVLAVTATWLRYLGSGPLWELLIGEESRACESEWWHHMLFINNYMDGSLCMPQMWYLAADTQLYIVGVTVFIVCRTVSPKKVLSILLVIGLIIPALHTYFQDLDGILIVSPSTASSFFTSDPTFNHVYKRGHTNLAGSVGGLALGYLIYHLQKSHFDISKYKSYRPLYWALVPAGAALILSCQVYYGEAPRPGLLHRTLVAASSRPLFNLVGILFFIGMVFKYETVYRGVLEWGGWCSLSRASYSVYLVHLPLLRALGGLQAEPMTGSFLRCIEFVVCALTMILLAGHVFWLAVEAPLGQLAKIATDGVPRAGEGQAGGRGTRKKGD